MFKLLKNNQILILLPPKSLNLQLVSELTYQFTACF